MKNGKTTFISSIEFSKKLKHDNSFYNMFTINKGQLKVFDNYLLDSFLIRSKIQFENVEIKKLKSIFLEAISYGIVEEEHIAKYAHLFLEHVDVFNYKPNWINYILSNTNYEPLDKIKPACPLAER